jgi:hypothetical protein
MEVANVPEGAAKPESDDEAAWAADRARELDQRDRRVYWNLKDHQTANRREVMAKNRAVAQAVNRFLEPSPPFVWPRPGLRNRIRPPVKLLTLPSWAPAERLDAWNRNAIAEMKQTGVFAVRELPVPVPDEATDDEIELYTDWLSGPVDWLSSLWLESTLRWARGRGWANRQHMLWGLSWPLPVGQEALTWWAARRKAAGWAGLPYSANGLWVEKSRPLTGAEEADADINIDALPLPRRDFPPEAWLGLCIARGSDQRLVWLFATINHRHGLDDHMGVTKLDPGELLFGEPLPGWPVTTALPHARWGSLRKWYGGTFEGRPVDWGGQPRGARADTEARLDRVDEAISDMVLTDKVAIGDVNAKTVANKLGLHEKTIRRHTGPGKRETVEQIVNRLFPRDA